MRDRVFTRTWWRDAEGNEKGRYPNNLVPCPGRKRTLNGKSHVTFDEALAICEQYNQTHNPGRYSRKAEFEEN